MQLRPPLEAAQVADADDLVGRVVGQGAGGVAELAGKVLVDEQVTQVGLPRDAAILPVCVTMGA